MANVSIEVSPRESRYCDMIRKTVDELGHATNAMITLELRKIYPKLSATTVHRATTRLAARGELMAAPADLQGAMRYETNKAPHDHFLCTFCGELRDVDIAHDVSRLLEKKLHSCRPTGRVIVSGMCGSCHA